MLCYHSDDYDIIPGYHQSNINIWSTNIKLYGKCDVPQKKAKNDDEINHWQSKKKHFSLEMTLQLCWSMKQCTFSVTVYW